jgi:hypothetical protein
VLKQLGLILVTPIRCDYDCDMKFLLIVSALYLITTPPSEAAPKAKEVAPAYQVQIADLMKRMTELESTVSDLQRKVVDLEGHARTAAEVGWTTCTIETTFNGKFIATEPTKTAAIEKVVDNCKAGAGGNSIYCDKERANCGK